MGLHGPGLGNRGGCVSVCVVEPRVLTRFIEALARVRVRACVCVCVRNACASVRVVRNTCMMCSVLASMINATALI